MTTIRPVLCFSSSAIWSVVFWFRNFPSHLISPLRLKTPCVRCRLCELVCSKIVRWWTVWHCNRSSHLSVVVPAHGRRLSLRAVCLWISRRRPSARLHTRRQHVLMPSCDSWTGTIWYSNREGPDGGRPQVHYVMSAIHRRALGNVHWANPEYERITGHSDR